MQQRYLASVLATGLVSGGLFLLVAASGLGFLFIFLSLLPILLAGLGQTPRLALHAGLTSGVLIAIVTGVPVGVMYLLFFALPAWYFTRQAMLSAQTGGQTWWFPVGHIILQLSLYACAMIAVIAVYYASGGGISAVMEAKIRQAFSGMPDEYNMVIDTLASRWSFLIFPMLAWMWAILLYAHAWLATRILESKQKAVRASLAVSLFPMPNWMFYLLGVAALASLIGGDSMRFTGKACLITLLLPYFFLGLAVMHKASLTWPSRRLLLFFIYFALASQIWMVLLVVAAGAFHHLKHLNKSLSSGGNSST